MPNPTRWYPTEAQMRKLLEMRKAGKTKQQMVAVVGVSEQIVTRWLDEYDGITRPRHCPKYGKAEARKHCGIYFDISKMNMNGGE